MALTAPEDEARQVVAALFAIVRSLHSVPHKVGAIVPVAKSIDCCGELSCVSSQSTLPVGDILGTRHQAAFIPP